MEPVTEGERQVLRLLGDSPEVNLENPGQPCERTDPASSDGWGERRTVRAAFLREVVISFDDRTRPSGLRLHGARIEGSLDLSWMLLGVPLRLTGCAFTEPLDAEYATFKGLDMSGSHFPRFTATGLRSRGRVVLDLVQAAGGIFLDECRISGSLWCRDALLGSNDPTHALRLGMSRVTGNVSLAGTTFCRQINMQGARIGGYLTFRNSRIGDPSRLAVSARGIEVRGDVVLDGEFAAEGEVSLGGAVVGGRLYCGGGTFTNPGSRALSAVSARIASHLSLSEGFTAEGEVNLSGITVGGQLRCDDGKFRSPDGRALSAVHASIRSDVVLAAGFEAEGPVVLDSIKIGGQLNCAGGSFTVRRGVALKADYARIAEDAALSDGLEVTGQVGLRGARIGGALQCRGGRFVNPGGIALMAVATDIGAGVFFSGGFVAQGMVALAGAKITGPLNCNGGTFGEAGECAFWADSAQVTDSVWLGQGFRAEGAVRLLGMSIIGQLNCANGTFVHEGGPALVADWLKTTGNVWFGGGFAAQGEVRLPKANIGGQLVCTGGTFSRPNHFALVVEEAEIQGDVLFNEGFEARGQVWLPGSTIRGAFNCRGGTFTGVDELALLADGVQIIRGVFLNGAFQAEGEVRLVGASIGGPLVASGRFDGNGKGQALNLQHVRVSSTLQLNPQDVRGTIDLTQATVGTLHDVRSTWPDKLRLDGFKYAHLRCEGASQEDRIDWLTRHVDTEGQPTFAPGPYEQLARYHDREGEERLARRVRIARLRARRGQLSWRPSDIVRRVWSKFLDVTVGFGYQPTNALVWLALSWILSAWMVHVASARRSFRSLAGTHTATPDFQAGAYALDVLIPIIDLGQRAYWQPTGQFLYWFWAAIMVGWLLITAVVAGLGEALRRS